MSDFARFTINAILEHDVVKRFLMPGDRHTLWWMMASHSVLGSPSSRKNIFLTLQLGVWYSRALILHTTREERA
jgi:hypothetical protein